MRLSRRRRWSLAAWALIAILLFAFHSWHGLFEGRLTEAEIKAFLTPVLAKLSRGDLDPSAMTLGEIEDSLITLRDRPGVDRKDVTRLITLLDFMRHDDGKPVVMVNLLQHREPAIDVNGRSSDEALAEYSSAVMGFLLARGSYPVLYGEAAMLSAFNLTE
jgi:hypothetical protein